MGFYSIVAFFQKGGMFMYPILLVFAVGIAIAVERWFQLSRVRSANHKMWNVLYPVLVKGEFEKAREMVNKDKSSVAQMLGMGLARQGALKYRHLAGTVGHHHGIDPGVYRGGQCEPGREGRFVVRQYLGGYEHHGLWADVGDSAPAAACQADVDHGAYR